jgi:hypothetical protein
LRCHSALKARIGIISVFRPVSQPLRAVITISAAVAWVITVLVSLGAMVAAMWVELLIRSPA